MAEITPLRRDQIVQAKRVIYTTAHELFHHEKTLEETITRYQKTWPLHDIDEFEQRYFASGGTFLVLTEAGQVIGTGGLRRLEDSVGEIKRLWLLAAYHGKGLGYAMMRQLLVVAREQGYTKVRLETSPAYQAQAVAFYTRLGFYQIPRYGDDPEDIGMELVLADQEA
jgi:ribosomal protein S18 acetylase RimI-like enzyme